MQWHSCCLSSPIIIVQNGRRAVNCRKNNIPTLDSRDKSLGFFVRILSGFDDTVFNREKVSVEASREIGDASQSRNTLATNDRLTNSSISGVVCLVGRKHPAFNRTREISIVGSTPTDATNLIRIGVSYNGNTLVSKTKNVGSTPTALANLSPSSSLVRTMEFQSMKLGSMPSGDTNLCHEFSIRQGRRSCII